jgi:hypothetical protein
VRVLGIDLSAQAKNTFACVLEGEGAELNAEVHPACDDAKLLELATGCTKVAIDAPFGWPDDFVDALVAHRAGAAWPAPDDPKPETFRASLSFRATDRVVMQTRRPLSVSTDRLGVTAMRCAHLLHRWAVRDRTGRGKFLEVYPAGALKRWGLDASGYKRAKTDALSKLLDRVCQELPALRLDSSDRKLCATSDDAFDAVVASLVARAAALGLTDGPPPKARGRAGREGWIHLPVRGSLSFLAKSKSALAVNPAPALAANFQAAGVEVDRTGYVKSLDEILLPSLSTAARAAVESQLRGKGGGELVRRRKAPPKLLAAHSSAALAANTFGPFLPDNRPVPIGGRSFDGDVALEHECRTPLRGTPPTLDLVVSGNQVLAVESKCTEPFAAHSARFSDAYEAQMEKVHSTWREEYRRLIEDPVRYRHLDAAQLIKHYLGLKSQYRDRPVTLVYLYWVPTNAEEIAPCAIHAAEIQEFAARVLDPKLTFVSLTYSELWRGWSSPRQAKRLQQHAAALRTRYETQL